MEEKVLLDVQINAKDALKAYALLQEEMSRLRAEQKALKDAGQENSVQFRANEQAIKALSTRSQEYSKEIQNTIKATHEHQQTDSEYLKTLDTTTASMQQMKAQLSLATAAFNNLSKAEREADLEKGRQGADSYSNTIKKLTDELKATEMELGNFHRNVGNYMSAFDGLTDSQKALLQQCGLLNSGLGQMTQTASKMAGMFSGGMVQGVQSAGQAISAFGKQLLALLANPIVAILAAIAAAFMAMSAAIKSDEEASNTLQRVLAPLSGLFDIIVSAVQKVTEGILRLVEGFEQLAMAGARLLESVPLIGGAFAEMNKAMDNRLEAVKAQQEAERMSRDMLISSAETENKVAKLRNQVAQKDKYTAEERRKFLQQAIDLERKEAAEQRALAQMRLKALQLEAENTENNAEMKRRLAEATAAVTKADTNFYNVTRRLQQQLASFNQELERDAKTRSDEAKQRAEEAKRNAQEQAKAERDAIRQEEETNINLIVNIYDQRRATINNQYNKQIEDLRIRLKEETNLTAKARTAINNTIINLEQKKNAELAKVSADEVKELQKTLTDIQSLIEGAEAKKVQGVIDTYTKAQAEAQKQIDALKAKLMEGTATDEEKEAYYQLMEYRLALEEQKQYELNKIARESNIKRIAELEASIKNEGAVAIADYTKTEREKNNILIEQSNKRIALYRAEIEKTNDAKLIAELQQKIATEETAIRAKNLENIKLEQTEELANNLLTASEKYRIKKEYLDKELEAVRGNADEERRINQESIQARQEYLNELGESVSKWGGQVAQIMGDVSNLVQQHGTKELNKYKKDQEEKKKALKKRLDSGIISEDKYNAQVQALDEETAQKEHDIAVKNAKWQKAMAIMNATLAAAQAIIQSLAMSPVAYGPIPNPAGIASLALATATGAMQIGIAASTPLPTAGRGMLIEGKSHAEGGVLINAEGGEAIINKKATKRYLPILSQINQSTGGVPLYGAGGIVGTMQSVQSAVESGIDYDALAQACANIPVYTAVTDINRGQARVAQIVERKRY